MLSSLGNLHTRLECTRVERGGFFESELHNFYNLRYVVNINMAEIDSDDKKNIIQALKAMKVKPKADIPEVFMTWMDEFVERKRAGKPSIFSKSCNSVTVPIQQPRISIFTGENAKGELAFDLWKYEVKCLLMDKTYSSDVIGSAIRKSLRGETGRVAMRLGPSASIGDHMDKLESVYGTIELREGILAQFYIIVLNSSHMKMLSNGDVDWRIY